MSFAAFLLTSSLAHIWAAPAAASTFGLTSDSEHYNVDTGSGLRFTIRRLPHGASMRGVGDITSLRYHNIEYQDPLKGSQINTGFSGLYENTPDVHVDGHMIGHDAIRITVRSGDLIHYYIAHRGDPILYMATWFASEPQLGLVRYIVRIPYERLPHGPVESDLNGTDHTVEAHDVFGLPNGETRSKHYSNHRLKDWQHFGATGKHVGVWMVRDNNEGNSGGPFYRSLLNQGTQQDQELTYIVNYGEAQTEAFRTGILNSYSLVFTDGTPPQTPDTSWFAHLELQGYRDAQARGTVEGTIPTTLDPHQPYTIGLAGSSGQYWCDASQQTHHFRCSSVLPGSYTASLYQNELAIAQNTLKVSAGQSITAPVFVAHDPNTDAVFWRIGHWDGAPEEFRNGDKITRMHPSDRRLLPWKVAPFIVGQSSERDFPAYQWKDINNALPIRFNLPQKPLSDVTLRIGITTAFLQGRPTVQLNGWQSPIASPSSQPRSRTLTVGTYRGNNSVFLVHIPAHVLKETDNELTLHVASGNTATGYLSPGLSYDAIDLLKH